MRDIKEFHEEVKKIIGKSYDDYYAEEYDPRFDYDKYNNAARIIHSGNSDLINELVLLGDFSEVCALVRTGMI